MRTRCSGQPPLQQRTNCIFPDTLVASELTSDKDLPVILQALGSLFSAFTKLPNYIRRLLSLPRRLCRHLFAKCAPLVYSLTFLEQRRMQQNTSSMRLLGIQFPARTCLCNVANQTLCHFHTTQKTPKGQPKVFQKPTRLPRKPAKEALVVLETTAKQLRNSRPRSADSQKAYQENPEIRSLSSVTRVSFESRSTRDSAILRPIYQAGAAECA